MVTFFVPDLLEKGVRLSREERESVEKFHDFTFTQVLRLVKYPMLFSPDQADNTVLVLPLRQQQEGGEVRVDWDFVRKINDYDPKAAWPSTDDSQRAGFVFKEEDYIHGRRILKMIQTHQMLKRHLRATLRSNQVMVSRDAWTTTIMTLL